MNSEEVKRIGEMEVLLQEVMREHSSPGHSGYKSCDENLCGWCQRVRGMGIKLSLIRNDNGRYAGGG
jgi:hypothetical protein